MWLKHKKERNANPIDRTELSSSINEEPIEESMAEHVELIVEHQGETEKLEDFSLDPTPPNNRNRASWLRFQTNTGYEGAHVDELLIIFTICGPFYRE